MGKSEMIEITRASSKGQIVIPTDIRKRLKVKTGNLFFVTSKNGMIVMKKVGSGIDERDLKTLVGVEEAWKDIEQGRYKIYSKKSFSEELAKW